MLLKATSINRQVILKEGMPLFQAKADEQEAIITKRLGELGVGLDPRLPSLTAVWPRPSWRSRPLLAPLPPWQAPC